MKVWLLLLTGIVLIIVATWYCYSLMPDTKRLVPPSTKVVVKSAVPVKAPAKKPTVNSKVDSIVIHKSKRKLIAFSHGKVILSYSIALGLNPIGAKQVQGDYKTPEGLYYVNGKNGQSAYHKNLGISYPNDFDRERAKKLGQSPGGDIKIHGLPNGSGHVGKRHLQTDWTWGCIALTNEEIDELFRLTRVGVPVLITA